jgi:hypothetical protein
LYRSIKVDIAILWDNRQIEDWTLALSLIRIQVTAVEFIYIEKSCVEYSVQKRLVQKHYFVVST